MTPKKPSKKKAATKGKPAKDPRGRKSKLSKELHKTFVQMCEVYDIGMVVEALNIPRGTYDSWIRRGKEGVAPFSQFYYDMKAAKAKRRMRNVRTIQSAADAGDWKAAGWLLSRLEREKYGDHVSTKNEHDVKSVTFADLWGMAQNRKTKQDDDE
jgi:hypothetical protein